MILKLRIIIAKKMRVLRFRILRAIETLRGLDTLKYVSFDELGFTSKTGCRYEGSSSKLLNRVFKDLNISEEDSILDMGSGKGIALITFSKYPFRKISGIELSDTLVKICKKNLEILSIQNVNLFNMNVTDFKGYEEYNYIYFYNPFPEQIFKIVLDNISESLKKVKMPVYLIYKYPTCHKIIIEKGSFKLFKEYKFNNIAYPEIDYIFIYKSNTNYE